MLGRRTLAAGKSDAFSSSASRRCADWGGGGRIFRHLAAPWPDPGAAYARADPVQAVRSALSRRMLVAVHTRSHSHAARPLAPQAELSKPQNPFDPAVGRLGHPFAGCVAGLAVTGDQLGRHAGRGRARPGARRPPAVPSHRHVALDALRLQEVPNRAHCSSRHQPARSAGAA